SGHIQMVTYLYKKGANPNLSDNQGYNALHLAAHAGHAMMILYLVSIGMDVDAGDTMGRTALMWAAYQGNSNESMEVLIKENALLDKTDSTGFTALHWAIAIAMTTNEMSNYHRFSYLIHPDDRDLPAYRRRTVNPFDMGPIGNCMNFWDGSSGSQDVDWFTIYEVPPLPIKRMKTGPQLV
ncbi:hypothetical protein HDU76_012943, partial [Blyttiomyces sp. JEL0837]